MAVTLTIAQIRAAVTTGWNDETLTRVLAVASATIERKTSGYQKVPKAVQQEAAIRMIGFENDRPTASQRTDRDDTYQVSWVPSMLSAWHHSGAEALLAPWAVHRAGVIEA